MKKRLSYKLSKSRTISTLFVPLLLSSALCVGAWADSKITHIMQNMEYAMNLMERGFLYNKKEWIDEGLAEFKALNRELRGLDPSVYLGQSARKNANVASGIVTTNQENIEVLEKFLLQNEMIKSANVYGRILSGCISCHAISRGW